MTEITVLDRDETSALLGSGRKVSPLAQIADGLQRVLDTDASVFVTGLTESTINSLRTRMYRKNIKVTVRKVARGGEQGHVLFAKSI